MSPQAQPSEAGLRMVIFKLHSLQLVSMLYYPLLTMIIENEIYRGLSGTAHPKNVPTLGFQMRSQDKA